jgi:hypothetical protein
MIAQRSFARRTAQRAAGKAFIPLSHGVPSLSLRGAVRIYHGCQSFPFFFKWLSKPVAGTGKLSRGIVQVKKGKARTMKLRIAIAALLMAVSAARAEDLTVYTALEADQIKAYQAAFQATNPDINIQWVRDSTGVVTAKLLAEKDNPQADVVMGLAATSLMILDKEGMLQGYALPALKS